MRRSATRSSRWPCSSPVWPSSTRPTAAWTPDNAAIVITHYQRLLDYIVPDVVHVLYKGRIIKTAGKELAREIEERGYDWIIKG